MQKEKPPSAAVAINRLHRECCEGMRTTLQKAIEIGELLIVEKAKCGYGKWIPWVKGNLTFGSEQARRYMRSYDKRGELANPTSEWDFRTIEEFIKDEEPVIVAELIKEPKPSRKAELVLVPGQERPLMVGGRPLPTMREIPTHAEQCGWIATDLRGACGRAKLAGISGDELLEMLRALLPEYDLPLNNNKKENT